ncbi:urease accessory protein UreH domain-containing protein [Pseudozobellia thermophila]|uniref:ABC-type nickel/cobalt efflux system, permease component RcnA n=1 Tax=Pseudozobellia thermophila TaxID=192903 RepID=A0A1M6MU87_9FLAO|nr:sulfite exporter TauE/SafE family protein [Pseudozobellia thermophila]SHJ87041.1 ABC-type nickel/cobalt efflux system, permease component RcnA [Pseudozobellia thermophila]
MVNFPLFAGIAAAVLHVVSGPDHLAAVTPLAIETRRKVWKIGLFWGFGHLVGMLLIGLLFLAFREYIPIEKISEHSEQLVGVVLIAIGLWALFSLFYKTKNHKHPHVHDGEEPYIHVHEHDHDTNKLEHAHSHDKKVKQNVWSSFGIGVLHGLAGVAHFILLLPVLGFESQGESLQYIVGFGIGTVLAMTIYTFLLGKVSGYAIGQSKSLFKAVRLSGGLFAIFVGMYWLYLGL